MNHIVIDDGYSYTNFIIQNQYAIIEIQFDPRNNDVRQLRSFPRLSSDIYQKIWNNNGGIQVQKINLIMYDEKDEKQEVLQYFFVDSRNIIQILFPNRDLKVDRVKTVGLISEQSKIKQKNCQQYKKIFFINQDTHKTMDYVNVVQSIQHLKKILDFDNFNSAHQLTFVKDQEQQVLYIQEPASPIITKKTMKDHECELCLSTKDDIYASTKLGDKSLNIL